MKFHRKLEINFHVDSTLHTVKSSDVSPETTLNTYLRDKLHLTASKKMCLEGGCGTCIVAVQELDSNNKKRVFAVNSCLVSIFSCHGWKVLTNEGIGNSQIGYHKIQKLLASNNGSQCGFCSSGMVLNMYALDQSGPKTKSDIENSFGGNLCRCTGYRPIMTAFKQLAVDSDDIIDLDDLEDLQLCDQSKCLETCPKLCRKEAIYFDVVEEGKWMKVYNLQDLLDILKTTLSKRYMLVAGNTAKGVYYTTEETIPDLYIDVTAVSELIGNQELENSLILGANINLTDTIDIFRKLAQRNPKFRHLDKMADHLDLVAHVPVRNIGTIAGNLMIKYQHNEFPSDVFLILETVNASLVIVDIDENESIISPQNFLKTNMKQKVIKQIILPGYTDDYHYTSYKIIPRAQNAHAMLNAGFLLQLNDQGYVQSARIVYGAVNPQFIHASKTESLLKGQQLFDNEFLQTVYKSLEQELNPDWILPDPSPAFRKQLGVNLFYKYVLSIAPDAKVTARNRSGASLLSRPVSTGTQQIYSKKELYPLTQPVLKLEALAQTSGRAQYVVDIPDLPDQLHAVFVKAQQIPGTVIDNIDASKALNRPGVIAFFSAKDIPGLNSIAVKAIGHTVNEELFCSGTVQYYSQPIGILVATTHDVAKTASDYISLSVTKPTKKPLFTVQEVLKAKANDRVTHRTSFIAKKKGTNIKTIVKGQVNLEGQYHFHMENQTCLVVPTEDGLDVYAGTQWMDHIQGVIAQVTKTPSQKINIFVRRLGGAFGAKLTRTGFVAGAAALAAIKLQKPVRMWMNFIDNMDILGKRYPLCTDYEVAVDGKGEIQYLNASHYTDYGVGGNESIDSLLVAQFQNCYVVDSWTFDTYTVKTDTTAQCYTRAPGTVEGLGCIESIMDHIAFTLNLDPLQVRKANFDAKKYPLLEDIMENVIQSDDVVQRKAAIEDYNKANRWKKKGLSVVPMRWMMEVTGCYTTLVSIYHLDGGIVVSHGGIEMGQGINTKVAQVCAYKFGIPLDKVSVKPSYNVASPNSFSSGGSLTSEAIVYSLLKACDVLLDRIKPIREKNPNATWEELMQLCYDANINLSSNGLYSQDEPGIEEYPIFGCCALELEIDVLTGKFEILRVDILEDVGQSMSPLIDIGQLEGAFVMGLGYYATEQLIYDAEGRLTNNRTWNYKVPGVKDIPQDFRVRFANNSLNPVGVLKSKAIAEPPSCLAIAYALAIRAALASARKEASATASAWYPIDGPSTVEHNFMQALTNYNQFSL